MSSDISSMFLLFEAILLGLLLVLALSWLSIRAARRLKLIDFPDSAPHKKHNRPTPLAGGIALLSALLVAELLLGTLNDWSIIDTFLAGSVVFFFGLWDDFKSIPPLVKLSGQVLAAIILIRLGIYIQIFDSPEFFIRGSDTVNLYLNWLVTILWVVGITNAFNFVDSMDGLAVGLSGVAASFFMLVTLDAQQPLLSLHSAAIIGVCIGLYLLNSPPALLFLGDSGAQTLGFILAVLGIVYQPQGANQSSSWFVPIMLLGVPIFDMTLVVFSRLRRQRPVYSASRDHTFHRLQCMGLDPFRAVLVMHVAALVLGCLAFVALNQPPVTANLIFSSVLFISTGCVFFLDRRNRWQDLATQTR